jgi:acyl-[acyl carrier protein]--UDP-N-acetylglucosamine O-acyltransferase
LTHRPPPLSLTAPPRALSSFAEEYGLELVGPDRHVSAFGGVTTRLPTRDELLTWATTPAYIESFVASDIAACVTGEWARAAIPEGRSALLAPQDPADAFYTLFSESIARGGWSGIVEHRGSGTTIAPTATIHDQVSIGADCLIMDNVVILPQTQIGDRVVIKPNSTIGGDGLQLGRIRGQRRLIPHAGGVVIGCDATIGSGTCVDRGLFGEMTAIGDRTNLDNLVHVAHSSEIGSQTTIAACAELSGSVSVGHDVWLAPHCSVTDGIRVGDYAWLGIGSVITRDVPSHAVALGVPARVIGWQCVCGTRLEPADTSVARCSSCDRRFDFASGQPALVAVNAG